MCDLVKVTENDYYIEWPAKIGVVKISDSDVVLIDSGNDASAGKRILKILTEQEWHLVAIYNTHSHADHIGGNRYLQEKTGCKCYCYGIEKRFADTPILEPISIFGARPFKELRAKFLMAQESEISPLTEDVLPCGMKMIHLSGHTEDMVGFITADKTAYIADTVSSEKTLEKYGVCFTWDYQKAIETLEFIKTIDAKIFVPSHAEATPDISSLADYNISATEKVKNMILDICEKPIIFEDILKRIFDNFSLALNAQQYALVGSTVRSYLSVLYEQGLVKPEFTDNYMLWVRV